MRATVPLSLVPTYQYVCTQCDEALEVHQAFTDEPLTVCPVCQGRLRKVYNAVGVVFKGSGFYRTDSRAASGSSSGSSTSTGSSDSSGSSSASKSDSSTPAPPASTPSKAKDASAS
jgi:putative FmdB family regulatory protein